MTSPKARAKIPTEAGKPTTRALQSFCETVLQYYKEHGRPMQWRDNPSVYEIFVSEIMLQQTQVSRVEQKFPQFISAFPDFAALATASLGEVLSIWQGMGYNRRARFLLESARIIVHSYNGILPQTREELRTLPGVGDYTSGAILTFAFNIPQVFIETNIRRAFLHHFFPNGDKVRDSQIMPLIEASLTRVKNVSIWYYALMDYGLALKSSLGRNPNVQSFHYTRQSVFKGSKRELRGKIIKTLIAEPKMTYAKLSKVLAEDERLSKVVSELKDEGLIKEDRDKLSID